ncbi:hypothetical protein [Streptomyces sp. NBC_00063]|uniref:hypothetical protein n=1 Tax=Streptomyces sp. NBC_00063 TaxID=2975638 RepID=UPI003D71AD2B
MIYAFAVQSPGGSEWAFRGNTSGSPGSLYSGCYGARGAHVHGTDRKPQAIRRWAYEPGALAQMLARFGFTDVAARVAPAPQDQELGTLLATGRR